MARLYSNENLPFPAVEELRRLGHDAMTIQEAGTAGQAMADEAVLAFAREEGRARLTLNRKYFIRLHKAAVHHAGIIACSFDPDLVGLARRIHAALESQPRLAGQLVRVNRPGP